MLAKKSVSLIVFIAFITVSRSLAFDSSDRKSEIDMYRALRASVENYLSIRRTPSHELMYRLYSSTFKNQISLEEFKKTQPLQVINVMAYFIEAIDIDISSDEGVVYLIEFSFPPGLPGPRLTKNITQRWLKENGEWYKNPEIRPLNAAPRVCGNQIAPSRKGDNEDSKRPVCGR
jgi:hypothetical protein